MRWVVISLLLMNAVYFSWRWYNRNIGHSTVDTAHQIELSPQAVNVNGVRELPIVEEYGYEPAANDEISEASQSHEAIEPADSTDELAEARDVSPSVDSAAPPTEHIMAKTSEPLTTGSVSEPQKVACYWTAWQGKPFVETEQSEILREEQREQETSRSFLVWIPPKKTEAETLDRLRELKSLEIESAYINRGAQKGGISLGLFSSEESVQIRLNDAKRLGITDAKTFTRVRTQTQSRALIKQILSDAAEIPENWQKTHCEPIASAEDAQ